MKRHEPSALHDAEIAIAEFGQWIRHADAKAAVLAAAVGVIVAALLATVDDIVLLVTGGGPKACFTVINAGLTGLALVWVGTCTFQSLRPRASPEAQGRFAWPFVARLASAPRPSATEGVREEAWDQAHILAKIAADKYRWVNRSLIGFAVCAGLFAVLAFWLAFAAPSTQMIP